ncbi:MAG: LuxR C-terminal-related transcriptional regulator [Bacteroidia bacterium]|nr:LuxR C-terminal-related transcriptional regulator [Bacteroidia bacterium]
MHGRLSKRELEVADMLVKGKASTEICEIMNLQPSTISTYKTRILKKLNVQNVIELSKLEEMFEEV